MGNGRMQLYPAGEHCPLGQRWVARIVPSPKTRTEIFTSALRATPEFSSTSPMAVCSGRLQPRTLRSHSMVFAMEGGEEYLYATVQEGTPEENWLFLKMKTGGSVRLKITAPPGSWL